MVKNGVDRIEKYGSLLEGKRLGLITSVTGLTSAFETTIDVLHRQYGLTALFAPEHGVRGDVPPGGEVGSFTDPATGVPVYSLYRKDSKRLTPEMLEQVDCLIYDIQDVGARYYTFLYTMLYALEDCAKAGKEFVVLDRVNPLGGYTEGNSLREEYRSFVGGYPLCMRYGLTIGEFAQMANEQLGLHAKLTVVPLEGWNRDMLFPDTGRSWIAPSMNIPTFETALLYAGLCLFEGTNLSEGRGTTQPFKTIGAPYIDAQKLASTMQKKELSGVAFTPAYFTPTTSKWSGEACQGVTIHVTDSRTISPVEVGMTLLYELRESNENFAFLPPLGADALGPQNIQGEHRELRFIELLTGDDCLTRRSVPLAELLEEFREESRTFQKESLPFQLY